MRDRLLQIAYSEHRKGNFAQAVLLYRELLCIAPDHIDARCLLSVLHAQQGDPLSAEEVARQAESLCRKAEDFYKLGSLFQSIGRPADALGAFDKALALEPSLAEAWEKRGDILLSLSRGAEALASYDRALPSKPGDVALWLNRGHALLQLGRPADALESFDKALALEPQRFIALYYRSTALLHMKRYAEVPENLHRFLAKYLDHTDALISRGVAEAALGALDQALASCDRALAIAPRSIDGLSNRGSILTMLGRYEEAAATLESVLAIDPSRRHSFGALAACRLSCCDWRSFHDGETSRRLTEGSPAVQPFVDTVLLHDEARQRRCAELWAAQECPPEPRAMWRGESYRHDRIRVAYLSADFKFHATGVLMAGVFEHHDRKRFEIFAFSYGYNDKSAMRTRLESAFDHFFECRDKEEADIAAMLREHEIDIAVDLKGYTQNSRNRILAFRAAPVHVQFLGYPGTLGSSYVDYILADRIVIPKASQIHYSENIAYLPDSYQPNDAKRSKGGRVPSRSEAGLPEGGFVFCSFGNPFKIAPDVFAVWMRLLQAVPGSVLCLLNDNAGATRNLRQAAQAAGVEPRRLVFMARADYGEYLARHALADLYLDTLPYNAHTSASDALWMGLPVLTCLGTIFPGRVAASLLNAIGLPEMVTHSLAEYEALALRLARAPDLLAGVRAKLAANRDTYPLFDTARFTRALESAYLTMWERAVKGLPPETFAVAAAP